MILKFALLGIREYSFQKIFPAKIPFQIRFESILFENDRKFNFEKTTFCKFK
jgi:hypothetical protein